MSKQIRTIEKINKNGGITLVALVITIIILIILATITINIAFGDGGLIEKAEQAKNSAQQATIDEKNKLNSLLDEYANIMAEEPNIPEEPDTNTVEEPEPEPTVPDTVEDAKENGDKFEDNTTVKDDLDNDVTIPGGFHIAEDSGTSVEEGIVIEDDKGNQFVWIPVGTYNVSKRVNSTGKLTNNLTRRTFTADRATEVTEPDSIESIYYGEENYQSVASSTIFYFKNSAKNYKGFYIGRYEQGTGNVCKSTVYPYVNIGRNEAKVQAEGMYYGNSYVTSELISSYAWDTALNFICQINGYVLAITMNNGYGNINTGSITRTGRYSADKYNNIYDFLGNCWELTTEYADYRQQNCVLRGGTYSATAYGYASMRLAIGSNSDFINDYTSFRIQLYIQ